MSNFFLQLFFIISSDACASLSKWWYNYSCSHHSRTRFLVSCSLLVRWKSIVKHSDQYVERRCYLSTWRTWYNTNNWQVVNNCSSEERHNIDNTSNLAASTIVQWNRTDFAVNRSCRDCSFDEDHDDTFRTRSTRLLRSMFRNNRSFARDCQIIDEINRTRQHFQWRLSRAVLVQIYFQICQLCSKNLVQTCDERNDRDSIHSWLERNEHFCENSCKLHCRSLTFESDFDWHRDMSIFDAERHHQFFDHQFEMWCQSSHVILTRLSISHASFHQSQSLNQNLTLETSLSTCHITRSMIAHFWINVCCFYFEFEHNHSSIFLFVELNLLKVIHVLFSSFYTRECTHDVLMNNISESNDEVDQCFFILVVLFAFYMSCYSFYDCAFLNKRMCFFSRIRTWLLFYFILCQT
jgi:hypothetical protein